MSSVTEGTRVIPCGTSDLIHYAQKSYVGRGDGPDTARSTAYQINYALLENVRGQVWRRLSGSIPLKAGNYLRIPAQMQIALRSNAELQLPNKHAALTAVMQSAPRSARCTAGSAFRARKGLLPAPCTLRVALSLFGSQTTPPRQNCMSDE